MPDIVDQCQADMEQFEIIAQMKLQAELSKKTGLKAVGRCHYCNEKLTLSGQLFCDQDCASDHEQMTRFQSQRI